MTPVDQVTEETEQGKEHGGMSSGQSYRQLGE